MPSTMKIRQLFESHTINLRDPLWYSYSMYVSGYITRFVIRTKLIYIRFLYNLFAFRYLFVKLSTVPLN